MWKLFHYLKAYKKESIIGPLFKLLEASFELLVPIVMASMIDIGIRHRNTSHIFATTGILILLGIVGLVCSLIAQYFAAKASVGLGTTLREDLFSHINTLSYPELDSLGTSTLITRMTSDINQIQTGVNLFLRLFLRSPFIVFGAMIMAFTINVKAAFIFVIAIPILAVVIFAIMIVSIPIYKKVQKKLDHILLITRENLNGARVVRAFGREKQEIAEFHETNEHLKNIQLFAGKITALFNPATYILINFAMIVLIWVGGFQVSDGIITQGEVFALVNYMSQILIELVKLANLIISITKSIACTNRINNIFEQKPSIVEPAPNSTHTAKKRVSSSSVSFHHVSFSYDNTKEPILYDINFSVKKGETIGIIGGTGSGKTSLVQLIPRFYDISSGELYLNGILIKEYSFSELRNQIGIVPQKSVLFKGTIRENMKWGNLEATDAEIYHALEIAQAKEFVTEKPEGLDTIILQNGSNLSGGQKQRLSIARALVKQPSILILDDSASALDFVTDSKLRHDIKKNTSETTVFLVSQRVATVKDADHILVLEDGNTAGYGTHQQLLNDCMVYREICLSQLSEKEVLDS